MHDRNLCVNTFFFFDVTGHFLLSLLFNIFLSFKAACEYVIVIIMNVV